MPINGANVPVGRAGAKMGGCSSAFRPGLRQRAVSFSKRPFPLPGSSMIARALGRRIRPSGAHGPSFTPRFRGERPYVSVVLTVAVFGRRTFDARSCAFDRRRSSIRARRRYACTPHAVATRRCVHMPVVWSLCRRRDHLSRGSRPDRRPCLGHSAGRSRMASGGRNAFRRPPPFRGMIKRLGNRDVSIPRPKRSVVEHGLPHGA